MMMMMFANCLVIDLGVEEDTIATGDVVAKDVDCEGLGISVFLGVASIVIQRAVVVVRQSKCLCFLSLTHRPGAAHSHHSRVPMYLDGPFDHHCY